VRQFAVFFGVRSTTVLKRWRADFINTRIQERNPLRYPELLELLESQYALPLCADPLHQMFRYVKAVRTFIGCPMDPEGAVVNCDETHERFNRLSSVVESIPPEVVCNLDETACSDHNNSREVRVVVPIDYPEP
jgi:hypothetical protein